MSTLSRVLRVAVAVIGTGPAGLAVARELAVVGHQVTVFDELPFAGGTMLIGVPAFRLPREAIEMDYRLVERLGVTITILPGSRFNLKITAPQDLILARALLQTGSELTGF